MDIVRFVPADGEQKEFAKTLRKNVNAYFSENRLSQKANGSMILKTVVMISMYLVPYFMVLGLDLNALQAFLCFAVMGIGVAGVGMGVMHDACHGAYSKRKWVNDLLSGTLYLLGSNVLNWKIQHNVLHHTYTNIPGMDEDIGEKGPITLSRQNSSGKHHRFQHWYAFFFYGFMTLAMLVNDFTRLSKYSEKGLLVSQQKTLRRQYILMIVRKIVYLALFIGLPLAFTELGIWRILLGFFIMHWVASIILSFVFQMAHVVEGAEQVEASPEIRTDWYLHQMRTTSDFAHDNKLLSWYVGGLNFQIEHHLFPNICHVHYKAIAPIVQRTAEEYGVPYNLKPTFRWALSSHISMLKQFGAHSH
jgi:linoleoyl-CoA desaturase